VSDVVTDVVAAVDKLRVDDRLVTDAGRMVDAITMLQAVVVRRLREAWNADAVQEVCGRAVRGWLREELRQPGVDVSRYLQCLHKLRGYPLVEAAVETAQITIGHVVAIITAVEKLPPDLRATLEPALVEHAKVCLPEDLAAFVDDLLDALGIDKACDIRRERRLAERGVDLHQTLDGSRALVGTLTPDVGDELAKALALAGEPAGPEDDRTPRQRHHDALGEIARSYLASHGTPSFTGSPRTAIVTIPLDTLQNSLRQGWIDLPDGAKISAATARQLACDAEIIPVVLGSGSEILDIGQANREFTTAQRRAAYLRDGGRCAFPDCRAPVTELHHIVFRRHGGQATLDNAAWLCTFHHWLVHQDGWTLKRDPVDKTYQWTGPHGQKRRRQLTTA